jgi:hypothetical protein
LRALRDFFSSAKILGGGIGNSWRWIFSILDKNSRLGSLIGTLGDAQNKCTFYIKVVVMRRSNLRERMGALAF